MIRHLASSARQQINGPVKIGLQKTSSGSCGRMSKTSALGDFQHQLITKPTPNQLVGDRGGAALGPKRWATLALLSVFLLMKSGAAQPAGIRFPLKPLWGCVRRNLGPSAGNETARGECKLSSTAATFHFPGNFLPASVGSRWERKVTRPAEASSHESTGLRVFSPQFLEEFVIKVSRQRSQSGSGSGRSQRFVIAKWCRRRQPRSLSLP